MVGVKVARRDFQTSRRGTAHASAAPEKAVTGVTTHPITSSRLAQLVERVTSICNDEVSRSSRLMGILFVIRKDFFSSFLPA